MSSGDPYDLAHEAALVGTSRTRVPELHAAAEAVLGPAADGTSTEARLLDLAAAVSRVRRATTRPVATSAAASTLPGVPVREIGPVAAAALEHVLAGTGQLLVEGLTTVADLRLVLHADATVRVLELATARPALRPLARTTTGERGAWLGGLNDAWSWAGAPVESAEPELVWPQATTAERAVLLRRLRRTDPARGRELLLSTLDGERADSLVTLLAELEHGLGPADEPALEQRLDDRRVQVRRAAAALLLGLDGPALVERAVARAARRLAVTGRLRKSLEVEPPAALDEELRRDAEADERLPSLGVAASLLAHDLERVPPARLLALLGEDAERLVALARAGDWWPSLRHALVRSARRAQDGPVLLALGPHAPLSELTEGVRDDRLLAELARAELRRSVPRETSSDRAARVLRSVPPPWGTGTANVLWPALLQVLDAAGRDGPAYGLQELARTVACSLPLSEAQPALDPLRYPDDAARRAAETVLVSFATRQHLRTALLDDHARLEEP